MESKFEEIFKKHAHTHKDALTRKEIKKLLETNREPNDYSGWFVCFFYLNELFSTKLNYSHNVPYLKYIYIYRFSAYLEWKLLHDLGKDKNGLLTKDTVRGAYDGSLFLQLEKQRSSSSSRRKKT